MAGCAVPVVPLSSDTGPRRPLNAGREEKAVALLPSNAFMLLAVADDSCDPRAVLCTLSFSTVNQQTTIDLEADKRFAGFVPQGIFIDASSIDVPLQLVFRTQTITIAQATQGYYPLVSVRENGQVLIVAICNTASVAGIQVPIILLNYLVGGC